MGTAVYQPAGSVGGTGATALQAGGDVGSYNAGTQEYNNYAGDTTQTHQNEGQVYYNTTTNLLKLTATVYGTGTWASGGALATGNNSMGNAGIQTAGLSFGGGIPGEGNARTISQSYNGTSWTEGNDLNTGRYGMAGFGLQTVALSVDGNNSPGNSYTTFVENYNGTSWSEITENSTGRS